MKEISGFEVSNNKFSSRIINIKIKEEIIDKLLFPFKKFDLTAIEYKPFTRFTIAKSLDDLTQNQFSLMINKILKDRNYIGITPDGPRGPNKKVSEGIIKIAIHSQVPIIPLGFASSKNFKLKSWDSFLITYPFSKCRFVWGEPITIPSSTKDDDLDKYKNFLEGKINDCMESAEKNLNA